MMTQVMAGLAVHFFACVAYVVVNYYGVSLYKYVFGGLTSRGASIGMAMYMIFYVFIAVNFIVALMPRVAMKLVVLFIMVGAILVYLLPLYPVRALAYSVLTGGLTAAAIFISGKVNEMVLARCSGRGADK
ncbi:hypothetical protein K5D56_22705 [Pseudomonas cichorii]|nr:hypothetical protein [Pseudomonas cichorii]MBX8539051.1 hypothetical protein [Pseudomonas cichorii]MBX8544359.1 hypothetical protein [Pseudomonas cichorii]MBX8564016.1 hypothetical protein [Pseudomonas cichorii]MBX8578658.1 hypothetical protein [Pseudomonas cichorii]MBX8592181.1 hypothetical protein [Pseudomonas cichorii]